MAHDTHSSTGTASHGHGTPGAHGGGHELVGHLVPTGTLVAAGLALLALTVITVAVRFIDVGELNLPIALGVALVKATIVILIFMHLRWDRPFNLLVLIASMLFVMLMMAFTSMDVGQYVRDIFKGNAPEAQTTLNAQAPGAPVTRDVESGP